MSIVYRKMMILRKISMRKKMKRMWKIVTSLTLKISIFDTENDSLTELNVSLNMNMTKQTT
eukprot:14378130-Ditylum_brightwellii.AAC.1